MTESKEFTKKAMNLRLTDNDLDEINLFIANSDDDFIDETGNDFKIIALFRGILKIANAKLVKITTANNQDLKKLETEYAKKVSDFEKTISDLNEKLEESETLKTEAESYISSTDSIIRDFEKTISDLQSELKNKEEVIINVKPFQLAPDEIIFSLNPYQKRVIKYFAEKADSSFIKWVNKKSASEKSLMVTPHNPDKIQEFIYNYIMYSEITGYSIKVLSERQLEEAYQISLKTK